MLEDVVNAIFDKYKIKLNKYFNAVLNKEVYGASVNTINGMTYVSLQNSEVSYIGPKEGKAYIGAYFNWGKSGSGYECFTMDDVTEVFDFYLREESRSR